MAIPSVRTTIAANAGLRCSVRSAPRRSWRSPSIARLASQIRAIHARGGGLAGRPFVGFDVPRPDAGRI